MNIFSGTVDLGSGCFTFDHVVRSIACVKHGVHMMDVWTHPKASSHGVWEHYPIEGFCGFQEGVETLVVPIPHKIDIGSWDDYVEPSFISVSVRVSRIVTAYGMWSNHQRDVMEAFTLYGCSCDLYGLPDLGTYDVYGLPQLNNGGILHQGTHHVQQEDGSAAASELLKLFPDLMKFETACPECEKVNGVWELIQHLNDYCGWARESVADWIEQVAQEEGFNIEFPTPENIPAEPGEEKIKESLEDS